MCVKFHHQVATEWASAECRIRRLLVNPETHQLYANNFHHIKAMAQLEMQAQHTLYTKMNGCSCALINWPRLWCVIRTSTGGYILHNTVNAFM